MITDCLPSDPIVPMDTIPFPEQNTPLPPENMIAAEGANQREEKEASNENNDLQKMDISVVERVSELRSTHFANLLQRMRSENDKPVAFGALRTLVNILSNIITFPNEAKYRVIKQSNSVIRSKILPVNGALDLLLAMGFEEKKEKDCLELPLDVNVFALSGVMMMLNQAYSDVESEVNYSSQVALDKEEEKKKTDEDRKEEKEDEKKSAVIPNSFDPFKPNIFRTSMQVSYLFI